MVRAELLKRKLLLHCSLLLVLLFPLFKASAQETTITGTVRDEKNLPMISVVVAFPGFPDAVSTDNDGKYTLTTNDPVTKVEYTYIGYKPVIRPLLPGKEQLLDIKMVSASHSLGEVVVSARKGKRYVNHNNPAVELIRKVIENKGRNSPSIYDYVQYSKYERIKFSVTNLSPKLANSSSFKKFRFLLEPDDSTGNKRSVLPVFMAEKLSDFYYRKSPSKEVQVVKAKKEVNFGQYMDQNGLSTYLNRLYADVDIYSNNIFIVTNQFLSPVADLAPSFYEFFITDTITTGDNKRLVELSFIPRNQSDLLFTGKLYISLDGNYAIEKVSLGINKSSNLNWVRNLAIDQDFEKNTDGRYHLGNSRMSINFGVLKKKGLSVYGERIISVKDFSINTPAAAAVYAGPAVTDSTGNDRDWNKIRPDTLSTSDARIYTNIDSLKKMPAFKRKIGVVSVLTSGFLPAGKVEIGAIGDFYSYNPVEGSRLRVGGRTTTKFSKEVYLEGYGAYGFGDDKWKYYMRSTYAFNHKSIYTFPLHYVSASYRNDTEIPGQDLQNGQDDNLLFSVKRGSNDLLLYTKTFRLDYIQEFRNRFSYTLGFRHYSQQPAGALLYQRKQNGLLVNAPDPETSEVSLGLRFAPHEQIFQGKLERTTIPSKYPVFTASITAGIKGLLGGQYAYQHVDLSIYKRFYLSQLGFTDVTVETSRIFGQAPYPLLSIHPANQTYSYQEHSYNLMNFLEFVSDHYTAVNVEHNFNGFILNKLPLVQKLKLKEILGLKVLFGGLTSLNNPALHPDLYQFRVNGNGLPITYALQSRPYVEANIGIGNIFKVLRVDLVKRLTYRHNPDVTQLGIRFSLNFDF